MVKWIHNYSSGYVCILDRFGLCLGLGLLLNLIFRTTFIADEIAAAFESLGAWLVAAAVYLVGGALELADLADGAALEAVFAVPELSAYGAFALEKFSSWKKLHF